MKKLTSEVIDKICPEIETALVIEIVSARDGMAMLAVKVEADGKTLAFFDQDVRVSEGGSLTIFGDVSDVAATGKKNSR